MTTSEHQPQSTEFHEEQDQKLFNILRHHNIDPTPELFEALATYRTEYARDQIIDIFERNADEDCVVDYDAALVEISVLAMSGDTEAGDER